MEALDRIDWKLFRNEVRNKLNKKQFELVCQLHAKYFKHSYYKPCTCNPKKIKLWIKQLNIIWDNGVKEG